jgi:hypothetical protein
MPLNELEPLRPLKEPPPPPLKLPLPLPLLLPRPLKELLPPKLLLPPNELLLPLLPPNELLPLRKLLLVCPCWAWTTETLRRKANVARPPYRRAMGFTASSFLRSRRRADRLLWRSVPQGWARDSEEGELFDY